MVQGSGVNPVSVRIYCDGKDCPNAAVKGQVRPGWIVVTSYPLYEKDKTPQTRRHLCRRCARFMEEVFK